MPTSIKVTKEFPHQWHVVFLQLVIVAEFG